LSAGQPFRTYYSVFTVNLETKQRAWLHLRKSRHLGDPDDPELLATHRAILLRLAAEDGITVPEAGVIAEQESGEFLSQRPEFRALLVEWEALSEGSGGVLYTMALDRLSRGDDLERARVMSALKRAAILIRTPAGSIDLADPDQKLLAGLKGELAAHELARFKWRVAQTNREKLRRGVIGNGEVPFGYTWSKDRGQPVPDGENFLILKTCCRAILTTSYERLAARYGIAPERLYNALHSPVICGYAVRRYTTGFSGTGRRRSIRLPRSHWIWADRPGGWEPTCTRAEWEAIQAVMEQRYSKAEWTKGEDGWCRDVLRFPDAPPGAWVRLQTAGGLSVYASIDPTTKKAHAYIRRAVVHEAVTAALALPLSRPAVLANYQPPESPETIDPAPLRHQVALLTEQLRRSVRDGLAGGDEVRAAHAAVQREIEAEIKALRRRIEAAESQARPVDLLPLLLDCIPFLGHFADDWPALPGSLKRQLTAALIESVPVLGETTHRRAVGPVVWRRWLEPFLGLS